MTNNNTPKSKDELGLGTNEMTVTGFESSLDVDTEGVITSGGALTSGTETFTVGATLNVGAGQVATAYQGTFEVMVAYD